jgi:hypothetical protein
MSNEEVLISKKKPIFPISDGLRKYLHLYQRDAKLPLQYDDLLAFTESYPLLDKEGKDTLWERPIYSESQAEEINNGLKIIYAQLKASGNLRIVEHKFIESIDYCTFGNTHPFRIKVVNRLNDVYDYYYVKQADSSRIYGLELEEVLSPNQVNYLVCGSTMIEEHIVGIPGDTFCKGKIHQPDFNPTRIAKEFVKFNERCLVTLLGDMRAYNFVVQVTPDFDDIQFRIRAIDFDQQFYEGNIKVYLPQFFKSNFPLVKLCMDHLNEKTVQQYKQEELSSIVHRIRSERHRLADLRDVSSKEELTTKENIVKLKESMANYYGNEAYLRCRNMTDIIEINLKNIIRQVTL